MKRRGAPLQYDGIISKLLTSDLSDSITRMDMISELQKESKLFRELYEISEYREMTKELNNSNFAHDLSHVVRMRKHALKIAEIENADVEIIDAAALLHDIARIKEDHEIIGDHAIEGAKYAKKFLKVVNFPEEKIDDVCHAIKVHRKSQEEEPKTLEAKIIRDADYLDALGAICLARILTATVQLKKYVRPVILEEDLDKVTKENRNKSAVHYMVYLLDKAGEDLDGLYTDYAKKVAKQRYDFQKDYVDQFLAEWHGER